MIGVQARVSSAADWIDATVCQLSDDPPLDFNCAPRVETDQEEEEAAPWSTGLVIAIVAVTSLFVVKWIQRPAKELSEVEEQRNQQDGSELSPLHTAYGSVSEN